MFTKQFFLKKSLIGYFSIAVLCLPLFFINVRASLDWGDDFAGYIHQAKNIVNGIPQSETGFMYNENFPDISIVHDIGFPLLLSPIYYFRGNDVKAFLLLISFILYILSFALMSFYNKYFSPLISAFLVLIIIYNPWTLDFKAEILSDIPFALFMLLSVNFFLTKGINKAFNCLVIGIMAGGLLSIRTIGMIFPLALLCHFIQTFIHTTDNNSKRNLIKNNLIILVSTVSVYLLLNQLLFFTIRSSQGSYLNFYQLHLINIGSTLLANFNGYFSFIHSFFLSLGRYEFLKIIASSLAVISLFIGMIYKYKEKIDFIDFIVAIYSLIIMLFPCCVYRYLFPIIPFLLYYMVIGLQRINLNLNINKNIIISFLGVFVLIQYYPEVKWIIKNQDSIQNGPQEKASMEAFAYIRQNTPKNAVIVFAKPRALALYTDRIGMANEQTDDVKKLKIKFKKMGISYLLIHTEETKEKTLSKFIEAYKEETNLVWSNEKFFLYKL